MCEFPPNRFLFEINIRPLNNATRSLAVIVVLSNAYSGSSSCSKVSCPTIGRAYQHLLYITVRSLGLRVKTSLDQPLDCMVQCVVVDRILGDALSDGITLGMEASDYKIEGSVA